MAASRGIKLARLLMCAGGIDENGDRVPGCVNYRNSNGWGGESGIPNWHHCGEPLANRPEGMGDSLPGCGLPLDDEALAGPANFCPLGLWKGLEPIDDERRREVVWQGQKDAIMSQPFLRAIARAVGFLSDDDAVKFYEEAIEATEMPERIADELARSGHTGVTDLEAARRQRIREGLKPALKRCLESIKGHSPPEASAALVDVVEQDGVPEWLALELKDELGLS